MSLLTQKRRLVGMRQEDLAQKVAVSPSCLSLYETGSRAIPYEIAVRIATALSCEVSDIFIPVKFKVLELREDEMEAKCDAAD